MSLSDFLGLGYSVIDLSDGDWLALPLNLIGSANANFTVFFC